MLEAIKLFAKKIPFVSTSYRFIRDAVVSPPSPPTTEDIFTRIFKKNAWGGMTSVSGLGSDPEQTRRIVAELPALLRDMKISTMLDIPCGDFNWMKTVDLEGIKYLGADIVKALVKDNEKYQTSNVNFTCANIMTDNLPAVDLVFCRDCLVHLSYADIFRALRNICNSGSTYLLTTTFPERTENQEITTGEWRPLNLERQPLNFAPPLRTIVEGCTEENGLYSDKSLGLWRISDLKRCLPENH